MKQPYASDSSVVMKDKLPEWPENDAYSLRYGPHSMPWVTYERDAALARMEALKPYTQHADDCEKWDPENEGLSDTLQCTCGLSELLAACERGAATQSSGAGRKEAGR